MAVHCSSNVILLAIEYFLDSKGERQNIKLLSTQNNYSPSFGLKKLVIFFISSDKTDKKNSAGAGSTKHAAERSEGVAKVWRLVKGQVGPGGTITAKSTGAPQNAWRLKLKKIQRIYRNIDGKNLFQAFFNLTIFLFIAKSGGGDAKKWRGRGPTSPSPSAVPVREGQGRRPLL